jgi:hypothetical protein
MVSTSIAAKGEPVTDFAWTEAVFDWQESCFQCTESGFLGNANIVQRWCTKIVEVQLKYGIST